MLIFLLAVLHMVAAQYCLPGAYQATCESVLIVHSAARISYTEDVQTKVSGTNTFRAVDTFDATVATPTMSQLGAYDAVLVFTNGSFSNGTMFGDLLAAYHDQGGGVVISLLHKQENTDFMGAFGTPANGYAILDYISGNLDSSPGSLGDILEPQSPLLIDVTSLTASLAHRSTAPVTNGGIVVAQWAGSGREPLVVRGVRGNRTLVELNFFPASSSVDPDLWTGDGAALMRNALKYSRCMTCQTGTISFAGEQNSRLFGTGLAASPKL
jgi:hypothetical protein